MSVKWVVTFAGARDDYQIAIALHEVGLLEALITDWYSPLDRWWSRPLIGILPRSLQSVLERRFRRALPSSKVRMMILRSIHHEIVRGKPAALDEALGKRGASEAGRRGTALLAYSYYAHGAFSGDRKFAGPKVNFQVHPHPDTLRRLFTEEVELVPECRDSLLSETEMRSHSEELDHLRAAPRLADLNIVASTYTKQTLVEHGISESKIHVVPYGVDADRFRPGAPTSNRFRVLFVGQRVQRKGLKYLLEAWRMLALPDGELVIAGRGRTDHRLLSQYAGTYTLLSAVDVGDLPLLYASSDVFCMPSLAEGFGLVYLESLACGTPVIGTRNSGAADLVTDGESGFVVDIRDVEGLAERLAWCHGHRHALAEMRQSARETALRFNWGAFRRGVLDALETASAVRRKHKSGLANLLERPSPEDYPS